MSDTKLGRPKKFNTPEEMQEKIDAYFEWCDLPRRVITGNNGNVKVVYEPYTISGLCIHLDITRETLCDYGKDPIFSDTVKKGKQKVENWVEKKAITGELNPIFSIFSMKHNFGWKDNQQNITINQTSTVNDVVLEGDELKEEMKKRGLINVMKNVLEEE